VAAPRRAPAALIAVLAAAVLSAPAAAAPPPEVGAPAAVVVDAHTGEPIWGKRAGDRRAIASTTKLMTVLVTLARTNPDDVFTAPPYAAAAIESKIDLRAGEQMTVRDLVRATMLPSANDAANALAVNVGGSREEFVQLMNARARALGLGDTHYSTPVGLDDPGNYSTANDLAALTVRLLRNRTFARIVDMPSARLRSGARERVVLNRNLLVRRYPFVDGVKTGHTQQAGYVLVGSASRRGAQVVSVVLGASSESARDADSLALLRWGVRQFRRATPVHEGRRYGEASVRWHDGDRVDLVAERGVTLTVRRGLELVRRVDAPEELEGPLPAGTRAGTVAVVRDGEVVEAVPLVTASPVEGAGIIGKATSAIGGTLAAVAFVGLVAAGTLVGLRIRAIRGMRRERPRRERPAR
jgi:serine-type D-Ala-D-Ala carboxypeptidase (penicillin-binding protein 5/6)